MLRRAEDLIDFDVMATDGKVGRIDDLYFDDLEWVIRYFVVDTGGWLESRRVLVAPETAVSITAPQKQIAFSLTKQHIKESPPVDLRQPVSSEQEVALRAHYGWPPYWSAARGPLGAMPATVERMPEPETAVPSDQNTHLRKVSEVTGYHIHARDGDIGHVEDFLIDDANWTVRNLIVDTRNWLPGKEVLVAPNWIQQIEWLEATVLVDLARDTIANSPEFNESMIQAS